MDPITGIFGGALGIFAFFGGIALLIWATSKAEAPKRQFEQAQREREHALRLKALELGQPLPDLDLARYRADVNRAWAAGVVAIVVTLAMAGCAVGGTAMILTMCQASVHVVLVSVVWGVAGVVSLTTVSIALGSLVGKSRAGKDESKRVVGPAESNRAPDLSVAIQE